MSRPARSGAARVAGAIVAAVSFAHASARAQQPPPAPEPNDYRVGLAVAYAIPIGLGAGLAFAGESVTHERTAIAGVFAEPGILAAPLILHIAEGESRRGIAMAILSAALGGAGVFIGPAFAPRRSCRVDMEAPPQDCTDSDGKYSIGGMLAAQALVGVLDVVVIGTAKPPTIAKPPPPPMAPTVFVGPSASGVVIGVGGML